MHPYLHVPAAKIPLGELEPNGRRVWSGRWDVADTIRKVYYHGSD